MEPIIISAEILDGCVRFNYSDGSFDFFFIDEDEPVLSSRQ